MSLQISVKTEHDSFEESFKSTYPAMFSTAENSCKITHATTSQFLPCDFLASFFIRLADGVNDNNPNQKKIHLHFSKRKFIILSEDKRKTFFNELSHTRLFLTNLGIVLKQSQSLETSYVYNLRNM